eukprot:9818495-Lingulodinium_polyedra.AAC.1
MDGPPHGSQRGLDVARLHPPQEPLGAPLERLQHGPAQRLAPRLRVLVSSGCPWEIQELPPGRAQGQCSPVLLQHALIKPPRDGVGRSATHAANANATGCSLGERAVQQ